MRVLVRVLVTFTLVAVTALLGPPSQAEPSEQVRFLQFNMCAGNNESCPDRDAVAERLVSSLQERSDDELPHVITLNEICTSDFEYLAGVLPALGYRGAQGAVPDAPHCAELEEGIDRGAYGSAVFVRSDRAALPPTDLGTTPLPRTGGEPRAVTCVREHDYGLVVCVTHLTIEDGDKRAQVEAVRDVVAPYLAAGDPVVLGGDLNLKPDDDRLDPLYDTCYGGAGAFVEVDSDGACVRGGDATTDHGKIDFTFLDKRHFSGWSGWVTGTGFHGSDHALLWGSAWLDSEGGGGGDPDPSAPPRVDAGGPYETTEGSPVRLSAGAVNATGLAWDLDGDGEFDDASGSSPAFDRVGRDVRFTVSVRAAGPGGSATDSATVTVANAAPAVAFEAGSPRPETSTVLISGEVVDPGWLDPLSATVDWGDGSGAVALDGTLEQDRPDATYSFTTSHVYGDNGQFTVRVCGSDDDTTTCEQQTVGIDNVRPEPKIDRSTAVETPEGPTLVVHKGAETAFRGRVTDPGSDDLDLRWDFGDGGDSPDRTVTSLVNPPAADPRQSPSVQPRDVSDQANATYRRACVYELALGATDDDGGAATDSVPVVVQDNGLLKQLATVWYTEFLVTSLPPEHLPDDVLECYLDIAGHLSAVFPEAREASTIPGARDVLMPRLLGSAREVLDRQLLAAWLNFAHGPFGVSDRVDTDCDLRADGSFLEVMRAAEAVRLDPSAADAEVREWAGVLTNLNLCNPL